MQLVAYGAQDVYISGNPQITFWKNLYRRHTHFSVENMELTFSGSADFGKRVNCIVSRMGDLVHKMYVRIKLPEVMIEAGSTDSEFRWLDNLGHLLLKNVDIEIGGQRIDRHYSEWFQIYNELNLPPGLKKGYDRMIGNVPELTDLRVVKAGEMETVPSYIMWVPLQFWFNRNPGLALPLIALQYHEVRITIDFRAASECYYASKPGTITMQSSLDAQLYANFVFLDSDERKKFAQAAHEYLFEQLQYSGEEALNGANAKIKMTLNHPVKELVWVIQRNEYTDPSAEMSLAPGAPLNAIPERKVDHYKGMQLLNFTTDWDDNYVDDLYLVGNTSLTTAFTDEIYKVENLAITRTTRRNPLREFKMSLNNHDRFSMREGAYFDLVQPYECHDNVPENRGINVFSFALRPSDQQPSGTCNFSRIDNATLHVNTETGVGASAKIKVFAVNYNVLRIMSGMGGTAYSN